jgi:translation elongation factor EF-G
VQHPHVVALLGAPGSGKSVLAEALVGAPLSGSPSGLRHGSVGDLHVLDAPGDPELPGPVHAALRAASVAVLVLSPVQGLDPRSVALWEACERAELPLLVAVTQLDRPGADADEAVALSQRLLGGAVLPLHLPLHDDDGVVGGLLDLLALRVVTPSDSRDADPEHVRLVEPLRDELLELVLSGGPTEVFEAWATDDVPPSPGDLLAELPRAVARGDLQPVLVVSPRAGVGLPELRALLSALPFDRPAPAAETPAGDPVHLDASGPPAAEVLWPGLARVWSGPGTGTLVAVEADVPGSVVGTDLVLAPWDAPAPQFPVAVRPDDGLAERVRRDPLARLAPDARSGQLLLWTAGPAHAELLLKGLPSLPVALEGSRTGTLSVRVPAWCARTVRSDVTDRGGEVLDVDEDDDDVVLQVRLPAAELVHYALALARASGACGSFERLTGPLT